MSSLKMREEEEEADVVLLIVRYAFQIIRLVVYVQKTQRKAKEIHAIGEISIDEDIVMDSEAGSDGGDSRRRSSSGVDDDVRRNTGVIF